MVKKKQTPPPNEEKCTARKTILLGISLAMLFYAGIFILYYLTVVIADGDTPQSSVLTQTVSFLSEIIRLFVDAW